MEYDIDRFEHILSILDYSIDTHKRRHMVGGILLSISLLFGGLAFTVFTTKIKGE